MASTTTVNTSCQVANDSGQPVVIVDAYTSATNVAKKSAAKGYQQALKILPLSDGGQVLADGATDTVTLDDTRVSGNQTLPNYLYQLLISKPLGLFPVMDVGEAVEFGSLTYPPITVTQAAAANMTKAFTFAQNIMAYPGSKLATGFVAALGSAQGQTTPATMMQAVADYFNTTKSFQGLDFPSYLAVSTHMNAFAWTWGLDPSGQPGRTYYLYAQSDAGGGTSGKTPSSQGDVALSLAGGTPAVSDPTDPNSGFTAVLTPASGPTVNLTFNQGQFVDDATVDVPTICLQGTYALKSTFTQQSTDNVLWPVLVGTVNGVKVIGVSQAPEDSSQSWLKSLMPKSFNDVLEDFLKIMGVAMAIDFLKQKLAGKKESLENAEVNENAGRPPSPEQQQQADDDADVEEEEALEVNRGRAARLGPDADGQPVEVPDAADLPAAQVAGNADQAAALNEVQGDQLQGAINEFDGQARQLAEIEVNPPLEDAMGNLVNADQALPEARQSGDFSDVSVNLNDARVSINESVSQMGNAVSDEVKSQIADSQADAAEYEDAAETIEEQSDSVESGDSDYDADIEE
jgi:hypothetical protein